MSAESYGLSGGPPDSRGRPLPGAPTESAAATPLNSEPIVLAALDYLDRGWHPLPLYGVRADGACACHKGADCRTPGKHPTDDQWQRKPLPGALALRSALTTDEPRNVGLVTGRGLMVLDVDTDEAKGKRGAESLAALVSEYGPLPSTYTVRTGSGGTHYYFRIPDGVVVGNSVSKVGPALDVRGAGGQVVAPPSVNGSGPYSVLADVPVAEAPEWLVERARAYEPDEPAEVLTDVTPLDAREQAWVRSAVAGELATLDRCSAMRTDSLRDYAGPPWNQTTYDVACRLIELSNRAGADYSLTQAHDDLVAHAPTDAGFSRAEVEARWRSARKKIGDKAAVIPAATDPFGEPLELPASSGEPAVVEPAPRSLLDDLPDDVRKVAESGDTKVLDVLLRRLAERRAKELLEEADAARDLRRDPFIGTHSEVEALPDEAPFRIEGLLPSEGRMLVTAQKKTGKTTLSANLCRSLLTGEPFLGRFAVRPVTGTVVFLNYEVSARQFTRWMRDHRVPEDRFVGIHLRGRRNYLASEKGRQELARILKDHRCEVLVVDPFGRAFTGESQDKADSVTPWLVRLDEVAESGGARELILTNHAGWNGERSRGSTALVDWPDSLVLLTKQGEGATAPRFLSAEGRDVDLPEDRLEYDAMTRTYTLSGSGGRKAAQRQDRDEEIRQRFLLAVAEKQGRVVGDIEDVFDDKGWRRSSGDIGRASKWAESEGRVRVELGRRGARHHYLADTPPEDPFS